MNNKFAKTKILATLGPSTDTQDKVTALLNEGIDGVRLNFSHGDYEFFENIFGIIDNISVEQSRPLAVLIDLQGPKIRIGELNQPEIELRTGNKIRITGEDILGSDEIMSTSYKEITRDASVGDSVLIDDGLIHLKVTGIENNSVVCSIIEGGILKPRKGMNLPGMVLNTPSLTEKDIKDLEFALSHQVDFIALSFVRKAEDVLELKRWLKDNGYSKPVISKIEKPEAVNNFDEILDVSDGIMVARGDLGVEMKPQEVPIIQKNIIRKCRSVGKLVITATQMLESMIHSPVPTRAEASDVANAVWDGTDVVMLSGETSVGAYPVEAVRIMNDIILRSEAEHYYNLLVDYRIPDNILDNIFDSSGKAIVDAAERVNANLLVVFTEHGRRARTISKFRPVMPSLAFSNNKNTLNGLNLYYGIFPYFLEEFVISEASIERVEKFMKDNYLIQKDNVIVFTTGAPHGETSRTSWTRSLIVD